MLEISNLNGMPVTAAASLLGSFVALIIVLAISVFTPRKTESLNGYTTTRLPRFASWARVVCMLLTVLLAIMGLALSSAGNRGEAVVQQVRESSGIESLECTTPSSVGKASVYECTYVRNGSVKGAKLFINGNDASLYDMDGKNITNGVNVVGGLIDRMVS